MKRRFVLSAIVPVPLIAAIAWVFWPWHSTLRYAVQTGNSTLVELALYAGSDPNELRTGHALIVGSRTEEPLLCVAAKNGNIDTIRLLIRRKTKLEQYSYEGLTPIGVAARYGHFDAVRSLHEAGANVDTDPFGRRAIDAAMLRKDFKIAEYLVNNGAWIDKRLDNGHTISALAYALGGDCNIPAIEFLIKHNADVNAPCMTIIGKPGAVTPLAWLRHNIDFKKKNIDRLVVQSRPELASSIDYENKRLDVLYRAEQILVAAGAK